MVKIWAKAIKINKIKKDDVYIDELEEFQLNNLRDYLQEICYHLDLENPVILDQHLVHLVEYRFVKFVASDFVDHLPFDRIEIHNLSE